LRATNWGFISGGYNATEILNIIRLATVVWGQNCKNAIAELIGDKLLCSLDGNINILVGDRLGTTDTNPTYYMVQENVESYDLGKKLRTFARISVRAGVAIAGEGAAGVARRQSISASYRDAAYDLRTRGIDAINEAMRVSIRKYPGKHSDVLASRLRVRESVESYDMGIRIRTFARIFVRADVPLAGEDAPAVTGRRALAPLMPSTTPLVVLSGNIPAGMATSSPRDWRPSAPSSRSIHSRASSEPPTWSSPHTSTRPAKLRSSSGSTDSTRM
jgi:hypothetical protein